MVIWLEVIPIIDLSIWNTTLILLTVGVGLYVALRLYYVHKRIKKQISSVIEISRKDVGYVNYSKDHPNAKPHIEYPAFKDRTTKNKIHTCWVVFWEDDKDKSNSLTIYVDKDTREIVTELS